MKKGLLLILIICSIASIDGLKLGLKPSELRFNGMEDVVICNNLTVYSSTNISLFLWTRWTNEDYRDYTKYTLKPFNLNISEEFSDIVYIKDRKRVKICLKFKDPGRYHGSLILSTTRSNIAIGSWIEAEINSDEVKDNRLLKASGTSMISLILMITVLLFLEKSIQRAF